MALRWLTFGFTEHMAGTYHPLRQNLPGGEFHFTFEVDCPDTSRPLQSIVGKAVGHVTMEGLAERAPAQGTLELAPFSKRSIRYEFHFTGKDGKTYRFDGSKSIRWRHAVRSWTTLPGRVYDESDSAVADVIARFPLRTDFLKLLASFRPAREVEKPAP